MVPALNTCDVCTAISPMNKMHSHASANVASKKARPPLEDADPKGLSEKTLREWGVPFLSSGH